MSYPAPARTDGALRTAVVTSSVGVLAVCVLRLALARAWVGGQVLPWASAVLVAVGCSLVVGTTRTAVLAARGLAAAGALAAFVSGADGVGLAAGLALLATVGHPACAPEGAATSADAAATTRELPSVRVTQELPPVPASAREGVR